MSEREIILKLADGSDLTVNIAEIERLEMDLHDVTPDPSHFVTYQNGQRRAYMKDGRVLDLRD